MTDAEIGDRLDAVLDAVEFTAPVEFADVSEVHEKIRAALPQLRVESYHRIVEVMFEIRVEDRVVCQRRKKVLEVP
jgi:hypothetical protein